MKKRNGTNTLSFGTSLVKNRGSTFAIAFSSNLPVYSSVSPPIVHFLRRMNLCRCIELQLLFLHAKWFFLFFRWHVPLSLALSPESICYSATREISKQQQQSFAPSFATKLGRILFHSNQTHFLRRYGSALVSIIMNSTVNASGIRENHPTCRRLRLEWFGPLSTLVPTWENRNGSIYHNCFIYRNDVSQAYLSALEHIQELNEAVAISQFWWSPRPRFWWAITLWSPWRRILEIVAIPFCI